MPLKPLIFRALSSVCKIKFIVPSGIWTKDADPGNRLAAPAWRPLSAPFWRKPKPPALFSCNAARAMFGKPQALRHALAGGKTV
jgi:hypothetical protein